MTNFQMKNLAERVLRLEAEITKMKNQLDMLVETNAKPTKAKRTSSTKKGSKKFDGSISNQ